jgi:molybdopterin-biosynthesis enzyme MoeA-like protein
MRIPPVIEGGGRGAYIKRHLPHDVVNRFGRDARYNMRGQRIKNLRRKQPGFAHPGKAFLPVKLDRFRAGVERIGCNGLIIGHHTFIATIGELCERRSCRYGTGMTTRIYTAALTIIGDEILSGRTQDKNIAQIALWLNIQGIRLAEVRVVPDVEDAIVEAVNALRARNDYLFTTGGIGPTHDDITVDAIAKALGVPVVIHPQARAVLEGYYAARGGLTDARLRMARVPEGANLIANRMSGAPGIHVGNVFIMAGVPHITAGMLDALTGTLEGGAPMLSRTVGCWVAESEIAEMLGATEKAHAGCQIGSYPFFREGRVGSNFVVRSTEQVALDACANALVAALAAGGRDAVEGGI